MEQDRTLRFLIPPFVLLFSLLLGARIDLNICLLNILKCVPAGAVASIIAIVASGGVVVIAMGFLISAISIGALRFFFRRIKGIDFEAHISPKYYEVLQKVLGSPTKISKNNELYPIATYDHYIIHKDIHDWVQRRWNSFITSTNCATALLCSHLLGWFFGVAQSLVWWLITLLLVIILSYNASRAWKQTMEMLEFQLSCSPGNHGDSGNGG